jgi:drug/metabolite transporter (DMT)-like permease
MVFSRKSSSAFKPMEITYFSCMLGAAAFNGVNIVRHLIKGDILEYFTPYFDLDNMVGFVFLAVISTIVATGMNNFALKYMQVSTMSAFGGLSTMVTIAVGVIFAHEKLYTFHIIGLTLIVIRMVGVSVIAIRKEKNKRNDQQ